MQGRQGCTALLRYGDLDTSTNCSTPPTPMTRLLRSGTRNRQIDSTRARRARARAAASRRAQLRRLGRGNPTVDNRARAGDNVHPPLPACISSCDARPLLLYSPRIRVWLHGWDLTAASPLFRAVPQSSANVIWQL
eukprot:SAG25_NODE_964_length_4522_cov_16.238978_8_plen_136_part_00